MMGKVSRTGIFIALIPVFLQFLGCKEEERTKQVVLATAVPDSVSLHTGSFGLDGRYIEGAALVQFAARKGSAHHILTEDFFSACAPSLDHKGQRVLFAGQLQQNDTWQIYVMDLPSGKVRQVTDSETNCTAPLWLPDGRIAFSKTIHLQRAGMLHNIFACMPDGTDMERITYHPNTSLASFVASDGRILLESRRVFPDKGPWHVLAMRPDGTKAELFYKNALAPTSCEQLAQTPGGAVFFVEKTAGQAGRVVSVSYGTPLSTRQPVELDGIEHVHSLFAVDDTTLLVSGRQDSADPFGLYRCEVNAGAVGPVMRLEGYHVIEPVLVRPQDKPLQLPRVVDASNKRGTFLCHDIHCSTTPARAGVGPDSSAHYVRVLGLEGEIGVVEVSADGSFYIEIDADVPVRFESLNTDKETIRGPSSWVWVRPSERRSCIGCHEDRELAPENRVPDAIYDGMVSLPEGTRSDPVVLTEGKG